LNTTTDEPLTIIASENRWGQDRRKKWQSIAKMPQPSLAWYLGEIFTPAPNGAALGSILGAYIYKGVLRDRGFAIVPLNPSHEMQAAFQRGWFKPFHARYAALIRSSWPGEDPKNAPSPQQQGSEREPLTEQEFKDRTIRIINTAVASNTPVNDALTATAKALGVMIAVTARRDGVSYDELLKCAQEAVGSFAEEARRFPNA
jgi:hypothetical protein